MSNYGDLHFGVPVFEYFPWYSYPYSISESPKLSRFYPLYRGGIEFDMCSVWYRLATYDVEPFVRDRQVIHGGYVLQTGGGLNNSPIFVIDPFKKSMNENNTIENWIDVEKLRLIANLGLKSKAEKYINNIDRLNDFVDAIEDGELDYHGEFNIDTDFIIKSTKSLLREGIIKPTNEDVISYIKNYNGSVDFYNSLKSYISKNGELTWKQIESIKKKPPIDIFNLPDFCLKIRNPKVSNFITPRLLNMGYKIINNFIY